jgi:fibronectin-binding autotransporter adhesin
VKRSPVARLRLALFLAAVLTGPANLHAQQTLYWDLNGSTPGLGGAGPANWTTGGMNANWSTVATGDVIRVNWADGSNAVFDGIAGRVTLSSNIMAPSVTFNVTGYQLETLSGTRALTAPITLASGVGLKLAPNFGTTVNHFGSAGTIDFSGSIAPAAGATGTSLTLVGSQLSTNFARINLLAPAAAVSVPTINVVANVTDAGTGTGVAGFNAGNATTSGVSASISTNVVNNSTTRFLLGADQGNSLTFSGQITGSGGVFFAAGSSGGAGVVTLTNMSNHTGATTINNAPAGVVRLGANDALSPASALQFGAGSSATGALDVAGFNQTVASLAVTGTGTVNGIANTGATPSTLTINNTAGTTTTYSSVIGVPGNLTNLAGANNNIALTLAAGNTGTQVLTGANTYTGPTTVNGGTLRLFGAGSIASSATITVAAGATLDVAAVTGGFSLANGQTLKGDGTVSGDITVAAGATLAPGGGVGTLAAGATTVQGGGALEIEIAGNGDTAADRDQLVVTGALNLLSTGAVIRVKQAAGTFDPAVTHSYTIATTTAGVLVDGSATGSLAGVQLDTSGFASPGTFALSRDPGGNLLVLTYTPVPEPAALAVFAVGIIAAACARRRRS